MGYKYLQECKKRIDNAVEMVNSKLFGVNFKETQKCSQEVVLAQVEINRAVFHYGKYEWRKVSDGVFPDREGNVLVSLHGQLGNVTYDHAIEMYYWCDESTFYEDEEDMNALVEAWKYIEVYKEAES